MPKKNPNKKSKNQSKRIIKKHYLDGKMILVTGGTGSFGKKFIKTILKKYKVKRVVVYSRDELKQEEMRTMNGFTDDRLRYFIGDVRDKERMYSEVPPAKGFLREPARLYSKREEAIKRCPEELMGKNSEIP